MEGDVWTTPHYELGGMEEISLLSSPCHHHHAPSLFPLPPPLSSLGACSRHARDLHAGRRVKVPSPPLLSSPLSSLTSSVAPLSLSPLKNEHNYPTEPNRTLSAHSDLISPLSEGKHQHGKVWLVSSLEVDQARTCAFVQLAC